MLRRRLLGARRHDEAGPANPIGIEFLDYDSVEEGAKLIAHGSSSVADHKTRRRYENSRARGSRCSARLYLRSKLGDHPSPSRCFPWPIKSSGSGGRTGSSKDGRTLAPQPSQRSRSSGFTVPHAGHCHSRGLIQRPVGSGIEVLPSAYRF
jgi:hypothetical protein